MPVLPGITDDPRALEALVKRAAELRGDVRERVVTSPAEDRAAAVFPLHRAEFPHLTAHYRQAYATTWHLSDRYRASLGQFFDKLCRKYGVEGGMGRSDKEEEGEAERTELPAQLGLWERE